MLTVNYPHTALWITVRDSRILSLPYLPFPSCPRWMSKTLYHQTQKFSRLFRTFSPYSRRADCDGLPRLGWSVEEMCHQHPYLSLAEAHAAMAYSFRPSRRN